MLQDWLITKKTKHEFMSPAANIWFALDPSLQCFGLEESWYEKFAEGGNPIQIHD
jgi:hypothetical protein